MLRRTNEKETIIHMASVCPAIEACVCTAAPTLGRHMRCGGLGAVQYCYRSVCL